MRDRATVIQPSLKPVRTEREGNGEAEAASQALVERLSEGLSESDSGRKRSPSVERSCQDVVAAAGQAGEDALAIDTVRY